jgi:hypothetical protein
MRAPFKSRRAVTWWRDVAMALAALGAAATIGGCAASGPRAAEPADPPDRVLGWSIALGDGTVASYASWHRDGAPRAIGVVFSAGALTGLPAGSDQHHCFDRNRDGAIDPAECLPSHEFVIPLPDAAARRADIPFKWVLLNWNPAGHIPPGVYDVPHFDVHFYLERIETVFALRAGPCGPEFIRCDQFARARTPVPANYMHPDFKDVEAVVPAMGNHLIDLTGPEFHGQPFTRSWIYGVYDGAVTFYEEMVARAFLLSRPSACVPIKPPPAVARRGFYPTVSCVRHHAATGEYAVSIEGFVLRDAEPPATK